MSKPIITTQQRLANFSAKFDAAIQDKTIFPSLNSEGKENIKHEYLKTIKPIILLDNDRFGLQQGLSYKQKYRIATLQTTEKDAWDTFSKGQKIKILDIV